MSDQSERNAAFLQEMGVGPLWTRRDRAPVAAPAADTDAAVADVPAEAADPAMTERAAPLAEAMAAAPSPAAASIETAWDDAAMPAPLAATSAEAPAQAIAVADIGRMDWQELRTAVAGCTRCGLCRGRTRTVFGVGNEKARWLFIGEGPGRNEDLQGEPFVGNAGKLLDNMLAAMGLARDGDAFIANVVKCRPTDANGRDRPPAADEIASCMPYLQRQIALIDPTVIVALGKTAALALLGLDPETPVGKLRGTVHRLDGRPLVVTYHPAYLLRNPVDKRKTWADLCLAMSLHEQP